MVPYRKFWIVFDADNSMTSYQHPTLEAAEAEAKQLAKEFPGSLFFVLETVTAIVKREFETAVFRAVRGAHSARPDHKTGERHDD